MLVPNKSKRHGILELTRSSSRYLVNYLLHRVVERLTQIHSHTIWTSWSLRCLQARKMVSVELVDYVFILFVKFGLFIARF